MMNLYAHRTEVNDRYVDIGKTGVKYISESEHQFFLDIFPWLKYVPEWFPWVQFPRIAKEAKKVTHACRYELYEQTKKQIVQGTFTSRECMTSIFLAENSNSDGTIIDEDIFAGAAASLFIGGVDTGGTAIMSFVMQMLKYPEVQKRAQAEIDEVVGTGQLPTFDELKDLPYVRAICAEVLRHASIITFVPAHYSTADDVYRGYHIPAGTAVLANTWAMSFDPRSFQDPFAFRPERWLSPSNNAGGQERLQKDFWFGFGRRVCPGQVWTEHMVFIAIVSLLAAFSFELATDEAGNPVAPNDQYDAGFVRTLGPSKCKISPRSQKMESLIKSIEEEK